MRAISEWEPWGTLMILRLKQWETRGWKLDESALGKTFAIHTAKQKYRPELYAVEFRTEMLFDGVDAFNLVYGTFIGFVEFAECRPVEEIRDTLSPKELLYGNYDDGRFAWRVANVHRLDKPVPYKGKQGIFHWPEGEQYLRLAKPVAAPVSSRMERRA
jgi:hypothetical protein